MLLWHFESIQTFFNSRHTHILLFSGIRIFLTNSFPRHLLYTTMCSAMYEPYKVIYIVIRCSKCLKAHILLIGFVRFDRTIITSNHLFGQKINSGQYRLEAPRFSQILAALVSFERSWKTVSIVIISSILKTFSISEKP